MFLRSLQLLHYKNYSAARVAFSQKFTLVNGRNGSGKTNLIDAVHYLCLCKSYFTRSDAQVMQHENDFFRIDGSVEFADRTLDITCKYQFAKKEVLKNGVAYDRISDHVGLIPVAMIAPDDIAIINDGSDERRRFLDQAIAQLNGVYLQRLMHYNRVLAQRNALLRQAATGLQPDKTVVGSLNALLAADGAYIFEERKAWIARFTPVFCHLYDQIAGGSESVGIQYVSQLEHQSLATLLEESAREDFASGRTSAGIHKDDILLSVKGHPVRETGSQGQIKSFLISLKLAQCLLMQEQTGRKSILLLDDIFEKLDKHRLEVIFTILQEPAFGQIIITDADTTRSMQFCREQLNTFGHIEVSDAVVTELAT